MATEITAHAFWRDRPVLVTGATGLLGSWLTDHLAGAGAAAVALVRDGVPRSHFTRLGLAERVTVVRGEVEDFSLVERALNEYEIETVFHLAAQTIVTIANRNPRSTFASNIGGTWNVLEAARRCPTVKRIVVASSDKAYGQQAVLPYTEDAPLAGAHPYDVSKSCADLLAASYFRTYRLPVCITRCGNLFGGGDLNFNRIVPGTIRSALAGESPVIRSDGTLVRDYFYVMDAVHAYTMLAERMLDEGCQGEAFNFSNERPMAVTAIVERVLAALGRSDLAPRILGDSPNEIREQFLSAEKARRVFGWQPRFDLDAGLRATVDWYRQYFAGR